MHLFCLWMPLDASGQSGGVGFDEAEAVLAALSPSEARVEGSPEFTLLLRGYDNTSPSPCPPSQPPRPPSTAMPLPYASRGRTQKNASSVFNVPSIP